MGYTCPSEVDSSAADVCDLVSRAGAPMLSGVSVQVRPSVDYGTVMVRAKSARQLILGMSRVHVGVP